MALLKKRQRFCWLDERAQAANISVSLFDSWTDMSGFDSACFWGNSERRKEKWLNTETRGGSASSNPLCFAFLSRLFFWGEKTLFFVSRLFSFLNWCHVFNIICNVFQTLSCGGGGHLHSLDKHKDWQRGLNQGQMTNVKKTKKNSTLTQQKTKRDS